ncbi:MAG: cupin [Candidatus Staskawiczbacteria bacterium RIFCSPLOWO2_01_FULL_40_39]|uniref:Cupin n=1 Tax=Candidatus Staskawiczbacteria bacterium RIFCSPHIGHO2_01_FULL_39_25 TaxID=1802202 RepID=A0A1G2HRM4_9BACT|nr:MAG: cupin [Candidatus Staskawiczbacteria bacterium RIFCSPHIGHO2_01_FULL_39_25]OGZ72832.1 MAG: cupin [Candidatus Staskawiczbacteria bacterium RIFCSPLOWO2_01_FULL_40_39]
MAKLESKKFDSPDETVNIGRGKVEVISLGGFKVRKLTLQPGWRWSEDVKPMAKTESCKIPHLNIHISGKLGVKMDDGTEQEFGSGDVALLPPGHDGWVVGNEPAIIIEQTPT